MYMYRLFLSRFCFIRFSEKMAAVKALCAMENNAVYDLKVAHEKYSPSYMPSKCGLTLRHGSLLPFQFCHGLCFSKLLLKHIYTGEMLDSGESVEYQYINFILPSILFKDSRSISNIKLLSSYGAAVPKGKWHHGLYIHVFGIFPNPVLVT